MSGKRILVVDDDPGMVETLCDVLELHGWMPLRAYDGAEAIASVAENEVDIVLMDIRMPRVNGADALHEIRLSHPDLPVLLVTAIAVPDLVARAKQDGALGVLKKPLDLTVLLDMLERAVPS